MRVVVADTTPIRYLSEIGRLELLPELFETIFIPTVVYAELQHRSALPQVRDQIKTPPNWLKIAPASAATADPDFLSLDDGEKAALLLGLDLKADLILIDERKGAAVARQKGFEITGTLGILVLAARRRMLDLEAAFEQLRLTTFHCSEQIMKDLVEKEKKRPRP